jgi:hypothetical protein
MQRGCFLLHRFGDRGSSIPIRAEEKNRKLLYGKKDAYVFMADMWRPKFPIDGRYMWLPVKFEKDIPYLEWMDEWDLDFL